jgi:RNA polymerase sporulation-specific sigma factor
MESLTDLIDQNKNLIYKVTTLFNGYSNKEDLFQVGCIGLINAYKKYDESYNTKFSTYAYPYILGEISSYVKKDKGIKVSREIGKLNSMIERASVLLTQKLMREPSVSEIANYLEIDESLVVDALRARYPIMSTDSVINDDGRDITLLDTIPDINDMDMNTLVALKEELLKLDSFERELINERFVQNLTQSEVATNLGISQVQVSRKEQKVLSKIRSNLIS